MSVRGIHLLDVFDDMPRNPASAVKWASILFGVAGAVIFVKGVVAMATFGTMESDGSPSPAPLVVVNILVSPGILLATGLWVRHLGVRAARACGLPLTLGAVTLVWLSNALNADPSTGSMLFVVFPTVYAAYHLRPAPTALVTAASLFVVIWQAANYTPGGIGGERMAYFALALVATAVIIGRASADAARTEQRLAAMADRDSLTGLATRSVLDRKATELLANPGVEGVGLVVLDVDHFKSVNDALGHPGGDAILERVAAVLMAATGPDDVICRLGGDEFVILVPHCGADDVHHRAERIVSRAHDIDLPEGCPPVTLSAGVAHAPHDGTSLLEVFAAADRRLLEAKRSGRDQVGRLPYA